MAEQYPAQNPRAAWRVYDGEAVIISPDDSTLHTLNAAGTLNWGTADGQTALSTVVDRICDEFEVERERAAQDAATFIELLARRGLLVVLDAPQTGLE